MTSNYCSSSGWTTVLLAHRCDPETPAGTGVNLTAARACCSCRLLDRRPMSSLAYVALTLTLRK